MKQRISRIVLICFMTALFSLPAYARSGACSSPRVEAGSYVFQLSARADAEAVGALADVDVLCEDAQIFRTDDPELLLQLKVNGDIEQYARDGTIRLDSLPEEMEALNEQDYRSAMLGYGYAAAKGITGSGVKIAVIDSGLWNSFSDHSAATILPGVNFLAEAGSAGRSDVEDTYGHGTFVTSIICGDEIGLAPDVSILPLKCFDGNVSEYSYVIEAINTAIEEDCDIINLSLGGEEQYPLLEEAVQLALDSGIIVVAAAGNVSSLRGSTGNDAKLYPAAHPGVIAVGAVDRTKTVWKKSVQNDSVCVVAPGVAASGLSIASSRRITNNGTSFAAPVVTATAALALSADSSLTPADFTELLTSTAEDLGAEGKDNSYGYGLVNPALLLAALTEDTERIILTAWNGAIGISAYLPDSDGSYIISCCNGSGKMLSVKTVDRLCSLLLPSDTASIRIFSIDKTCYAPVQTVRRYE